MADEDKIKYSDIIQPDDSIEKLIKQLGELNQSYETMVNAIRAGADRVVHALKTASGATNEGRKSIDEATASTSRLERAQNELKIAMSDTGKQIAWLKAQTVDQNKATVEQQRYLQQALSSYDRLKSDLKQTVSLYKSLTDAEREDSAMGQQLLQDILNLKNQIKALDDQMKPHIQTLTEVQKAEQKLAYLQSEEGQKLLDLKAKIAEVTAARRQQKTATDPLVQAQEKLAYARSEENKQLKLYSTQIKEANRIAQLQVQIANSAEGSYNRLSAQYELNKIKLNQMSGAEREAADVGKKLEAETNALYQKMIKLQEATGNYRLSVGHYQKTWDGLGISISQVVRELPAAAVSLNTFFLGISNNIPMVVDEINRLRLKNKQLQAEGKATVNVTRSIIKALFSWNTALVILLTVFSMFGKDIISWIGNLFKAKNAAISTSEAMNNIAKELESTNASYGNNIVSLKQLQQEWKNLKTTAEKNQWIKDNKSEFDKLGVSVDDVIDAENIFVNNTEAVVNALRLRAKATAAQKLAAEQYEKALIARNKAETKAMQGPSEWDKFQNWFVQSSLRATDVGMGPSTTNLQVAEQLSAEDFKQQRIKDLNDEANAAEKTGDAYFDLAAGYEAAAKAELEAAGIDANHKKSRREPRDLTSTINQNNIKIQKEYEESITKLRSDEYAKRRKTAADEVQNENNKLREMYRKNEEYIKNVDGKYKKLTEDQKRQIAQQNAWINSTIANNLKALALQLEQIQREQAANSLRLQRETQTGAVSSAPIAENAPKNTETAITTNVTVTRDASQMEASLVEERELMRQNLEAEYKLVLDTNAKLLAAGDEHARSEEEILIEFNKKKLELYADYDKQILSARERDIENQLELVKKGTEEELQLLLQQNEVRRQLALAENAAKPAAEQVSSFVINAKFDKSAAQTKGSFEMTGFEEQQALDEAIFNEVKHNETETTRFKLEQEKARWEKQIALAESGGLDWSQAQIDAAKSTVKGINRELSELNNFISNIGKKGLGGSLLEKLGFDDNQINALEDAVNIVLEQFQAILDAEVELAEKQVELAEKRVEAAQKVYDAEIEARNNGYANNVATAKKELEQEKKNQQEKQKMLAAAQKRQESLNTVIQASSLVTASANLWSSFSSIPIVGPALALAAIATMWTSFAVAKVKAKQVTASQSEEYGEGGLEFLEGGSHASGNDIDLGASNKKGKRMRAEGGEALAIINKHKTRKYRKILPDVIDSFNKGTFEDKYLKAFDSSDNLNISLNANSNMDLSKLEDDVRNIRRQSETKYYTMPNGTVIMQRRNVKRIIKN
nr:MAG TPA: tail length tape measure protein [Caudoviricetes sp.]